MRLALRELRRRPGRFSAAGLILMLIALLLMFLGGLLDGLIRSSTGAVRNLDAEVLVFSSSAENAFLRSRIDPELRRRVEAVPGVASVSGIGVVQLGARLPDGGPRDLLDVALFGTERPPKVLDELPPTGSAVADSTLRDQGVAEGDVLLLGPARSPVTVAGFVDDSAYLGQAGLWADPDTWHEVLQANRPDQQLAEGVFQSLQVTGDATDPAALAAAVDDALGGATASLTVEESAATLPGVQEQQATFAQIIGVTVAVAVVVVALFFALLTVERASLYGVLKAIGARSGTLFAGLVVQAVFLTVVGCLVAGVVAVALDVAIPPGSIPLRMSAGRLLSSTGYLLLAAVVGCAFSLRRVLRVDPASAIGSSS